MTYHFKKKTNSNLLKGLYTVPYIVTFIVSYKSIYTSNSYFKHPLVLSNNFPHYRVKLIKAKTQKLNSNYKHSELKSKSSQRVTQESFKAKNKSSQRVNRIFENQGRRCHISIFDFNQKI